MDTKDDINIPPQRTVPPKGSFPKRYPRSQSLKQRRDTGQITLRSISWMGRNDFKQNHACPLGSFKMNREILRMYLRIKPDANKTSYPSYMHVQSPNKIVIKDPNSPENMIYNAYRFRHIFKEESTQFKVFKAIGGPGIEQLIEGGRGVILVAGGRQTGKNYTMIGGSGNNRGLVQRTFETIFQLVGKRLVDEFVVQPVFGKGFKIADKKAACRSGLRENVLTDELKVNPNERTIELPDDAICRLEDFQSDQRNIDGQLGRSTYLARGFYRGQHQKDLQYCRVAVFVSVVELNTNGFCELLVDDLEDLTPKLLPLCEDEKGNTYLHNAMRLEVRSVTEAMGLVKVGIKRQEQQKCLGNLFITIFMVHVPYNMATKKINAKQEIVISKLILGNLASPASRRIGCYRFREYSLYQKAQYCLQNCARILRENQVCIMKGNIPQYTVPYRESRLTHFLKDYFDVTVPASITTISCISKNPKEFEETQRALLLSETNHKLENRKVKKTIDPSNEQALGDFFDVAASRKDAQTENYANYSLNYDNYHERPQKRPYFNNPSDNHRSNQTKSRSHSSSHRPTYMYGLTSDAQNDNYDVSSENLETDESMQTVYTYQKLRKYH